MSPAECALDCKFKFMIICEYIEYINMTVCEQCMSDASRVVRVARVRRNVFYRRFRDDSKSPFAFHPLERHRIVVLLLATHIDSISTTFQVLKYSRYQPHHIRVLHILLTFPQRQVDPVQQHFKDPGFSAMAQGSYMSYVSNLQGRYKALDHMARPGC